MKERNDNMRKIEKEEKRREGRDERSLKRERSKRK